MSTIKLLASGVELAGLVAAGAALRQSSGVGASQEFADCEMAECVSCANHAK